jgi:hypothetical protein
MCGFQKNASDAINNTVDRTHRITGRGDAFCQILARGGIDHMMSAIQLATDRSQSLLISTSRENLSAALDKTTTNGTPDPAVGTNDYVVSC